MSSVLLKSCDGADSVSARGACVSAQDVAYLCATVQPVAGASPDAEGGRWNGSGCGPFTRDEDEGAGMAAAPGVSPAGSRMTAERQRRHTRQPRGGGGGKTATATRALPPEGGRSGNASSDRSATCGPGRVRGRGDDQAVEIASLIPCLTPM